MVMNFWIVGNLLENAVEATNGIPAEELRAVSLQITEDEKGLIIMVSDTGEGIAELREHLKTLVQKTGEKSLRTPFRLPVDRVFSVEGFGTVVTGTLIEGTMSEDEMAELVPSGVTAKIRNLQVHGKDVTTAYAGQRVAVNLAGLKKSDIQRGDAVAKPGTVHVGQMLDVRLQNLKGSQRVILNNSQVHFYHGASVLLAKVVGAVLPLGAKALKLDPAVMASPFITTIVDAFSLLIYFLFANMLLFS